MKIAIHKNKFESVDAWIRYCEEKGFDYKLVEAYDSDIIEQLKDCDCFMWHFAQTDYRDMLFARQLLFSLPNMGIKVYPNFDTCWHFDDKVGEKYLLESIHAPLVPSYVFYDKTSAIKWINSVDFPKVFKLRGGAASQNVKLIHSRREALLLAKKAFGRGLKTSRWGKFIDCIRKYKESKITVYPLLRSFCRVFVPTSFEKMSNPEKGYMYFQDFIPNNAFDTRLIVIGGGYAFGERRMTRKNDFRASGSGTFYYDDIDINAVRIAFEVAQKLKLQSVAFDFVKDGKGNPLIVEMSYGFGSKGARHCPGYWTSDLKWHEEQGFDFYGWIIDSLFDQKSEYEK